MTKGRFLGLGLAIMASACTTSGIPEIATGERYAAYQGSGESYPLGTGDKLRITVFNEPTLSGEFSVETNGEISLPLIGDVKVLGTTPNQATEIIRQMFANGYLRDPRVSLEVVSYRPFFILGEVRRAGQFPYVSSMSVLDAIATAEGFTPRANKNYVFIRRLGEQAELRYKLTSDLRVWPGDTIRLAERYF